MGGSIGWVVVRVVGGWMDKQPPLPRTHTLHPIYHMPRPPTSIAPRSLDLDEKTHLVLRPRLHALEGGYSVRRAHVLGHGWDVRARVSLPVCRRVW